jgi:hypothetical protein
VDYNEPGPMDTWTRSKLTAPSAAGQHGTRDRSRQRAREKGERGEREAKKQEEEMGGTSISRPVKSVERARPSFSSTIQKLAAARSWDHPVPLHAFPSVEKSLKGDGVDRCRVRPSPVDTRMQTAMAHRRQETLVS